MVKKMRTSRANLCTQRKAIAAVLLKGSLAGEEVVNLAGEVPTKNDTMQIHKS